MKKEEVHCPLSDALLHNNMESFNKLVLQGVDMAKILLEHGADIEFKEKYGNTPLFRACIWVRAYGADMIDLLIKHGADVNAENNDGLSPKKMSKMIEDFPAIEAFTD